MTELIRDDLRRCPIFGGVDQKHLDHLASKSVRRELPARHLLFRQGDPCPGICIVAAGSVRIFKLAASGKEHLLRMIDAPQSFLEVAIIGGFPSPACAETAEPSTLVIVDGAAFNDLMHADHEFCLQLLKGLSHRVRSLISLLEDIVLRDATARIASHLLEAADQDGQIVLGTARKDLAAHLNLTPETVSRSLRRLNQHELIRQDGQKLGVIDREGLSAAAAGAYPLL